MDATTTTMAAPCTVQEQIEHALRFMTAVFDPQDWIELRLLPAGRSLWFQLNNVADARAALAEAVENNAREHDPQNVYVGANPRVARGQRKKADVPLARVLFADFDNGATVEDVVQRIRDAGLPEPSIVIVSGGGVHVYWLLAEPITDMAAWTATTKGIIEAVGSDPTIHNPDRIMRTPGTRNVKPERPARPMCHLVSMNDTRHPITAFPVKAARVKATEPVARQRKPKVAAGATDLCDEGYVFLLTGQVEGGRRHAIYRIACDMKARGWTLEQSTDAIVSRAHLIQPPLTAEDIAKLPSHVVNAFKEQREPGHVSSPTIREAKVAAAAAKANGEHDGAADLARPQTLDDTGAARRLAKMMRGKLLYPRERKTYMHWDGRRWCDNAEHIAVQFAKRMHDELWHELASNLGERPPSVVKFVQDSGTHARLTAAVTLARSEDGINVSQGEFDAHSWLLNVKNGVLNLRTGELLPHDPALRMTQLADVAYDPAARSELWDRFIREVTSDDDEKAEFLQQVFGLALTGDVSDEVLVCHNGGGCNGKSTALEAVGKMLGDYAAVAPPGMFAARKFDAHPTEIAGLRGKRFVTAVEQEANRALRESLIKQLTGGDTIRTRGMREDFWEMRPTWHIHMAYNVAPRLTGTDDGIKRRLVVVPWNASFKGAPDPTIKERLTGEAERAAILNWCLAGLRKRLAAGKLIVPEVCRIKTDEYLDDEDVIGRFLSERTEGDDDGVIELREMLRAFRAWMEADGVQRYVIDQFTANALGRELARRGYRKMRPDSGIHRKQTVIAGLRLVETADDLHVYHDQSWQDFAR
jgi:P4 family phage/plasmid primase-like protien